MSPEEHKNQIRRWILEVWRGGNLSLTDQLVSPTYVFAAPGMPEARGPEGIKQLIAMYRTAFPDMTNTIDEQIAEGNVVVSRGTTRGTHRAALGDIAATGQSVTVPWIMISRFDGDRIAHDFEVYDSFGLMQQLGVVPQPEQATM